MRVAEFDFGDPPVLIESVERVRIREIVQLRHSGVSCLHVATFLLLLLLASYFPGTYIRLKKDVVPINY